MSVPSSQGLVPRKILTQLSHERGAHREHIYEEVRMSSGLYAASSCTILRFRSGRGRHYALGGAILAAPPVPELCSRIRCTGRDMRGVGAPMKVISKVNSTFDVLQPCILAPTKVPKVPMAKA